MDRKCKGCKINIDHKHINAKFCEPKCKDKYWNEKNPRRGRGYESGDYDTDSIMSEVEVGWDAHKDQW